MSKYATKLKEIPILGREHLPSGGALVIPSQLSFLDLLRLEQIFDGRRIVHLVDQGAELHPLVKNHLHGENVHALEIVPKSTDIEALRKEIQQEVRKGSFVIYLPPEAATQPASLTGIPGAKLDFLLQATVAVLPLFILDTNDLVLAIEPRRPEGDAIFAFGPLLKAEQATVAAYQESLLLLSEQCFALNPILNRHLALALLQGLKRHGTRASLIDGKDEQVWRFDRILAAAIVLSKHVKASTKKPRVGVILPPGFGAMVANLAVLFAGKVPVNLNFTAGRQAVESALKQADLDHYLTADLFVRKLQTFPWPPNKQLTFIERLLPQKKAQITRWCILCKLLPASALA
ncbi:MAG: 2-acyl-glycerophospho-ethanolamine acyltransferase, partial [Roseimicrobium sp.]